jgi:hypothetical protein
MRTSFLSVLFALLLAFLSSESHAYLASYVEHGNARYGTADGFVQMAGDKPYVMNVIRDENINIYLYSNGTALGSITNPNFIIKVPRLDRPPVQVVPKETDTTWLSPLGPQPMVMATAIPATPQGRAWALQAFAEVKNKAKVIGWLDGVKLIGSTYYVTGWSCDRGMDESVKVDVFVVSKENFTFKIGSGRANYASEQQIENKCFSTTAHRFRVPITTSNYKLYRGQPVYARGYSLTGKGTRSLAGSGKVKLQVP